jgi:hypothetical protein
LKIDQFTELQSIVRRSTRAYIEVKDNFLPHLVNPSSSSSVTITVGQHANASGGNGGEHHNADVHLLSGLFSALVNQFTVLADVYAVMSRAVHRSVERNAVEGREVRIDKNEIWSKVQTVAQLMLTDYLDFSHETSIHQPTSAQFSEPTSDINSYFVRRKVVRPKKVSFFRFDSSSTGLSLNDFYKEKKKEDDVRQMLFSPKVLTNCTVLTFVLSRHLQPIQLPLEVLTFFARQKTTLCSARQTRTT